MENRPKLIIKYSEYLDPIYMAWIKSTHPDWIPPTKDEVLLAVENYRKLRDKHADNILDSITKITGLNYTRNEIPIYVVSGSLRTYSSPIVLKATYTDEEFLTVLAHELIHCVYSDNYKKVNDFISYGMKEMSTRANDHVYLHAILKSVYLDILRMPELLETNLKVSYNGKNPDYKNAWDIVEQVGYKELITEFRSKINK